MVDRDGRSVRASENFGGRVAQDQLRGVGPFTQKQRCRLILVGLCEGWIVLYTLDNRLFESRVRVVSGWLSAEGAWSVSPYKAQAMCLPSACSIQFHRESVETAFELRRRTLHLRNYIVLKHLRSGEAEQHYAKRVFTPSRVHT